MKKNKHKLGNTNLVPHSPFLLMRYQTHTSMEYCNKFYLKYLFKNVNKGLE